jgi:hypothetical protein
LERKGEPPSRPLDTQDRGDSILTVATAALTVVLLAAAPTSAQTAAPAEPAAGIERPRPKRTDVAYPRGAHGDAIVVLELDVGADGSVTSARAITGPEPFARAAVAAADGFVFEPARRDGKPVASKIRLQIRFLEPAAPKAEPETEAPAPAAPTPAPAPTAEAPIEVTVYGERTVKPPSTSLSRAEVRELPGAFGDPFRAIESLPGVTPVASGLPFFYVRGAPPGNVGYFLDGVRVPYLYHIALGPSVVHPGLVERVDLYPGGYPAQFGRYTGGIVSAETAEPRPELHGEYNVRLFDLGALAETGFDEGRGTALAAFRYSYTAFLLSRIVPEVELDYRDYAARISYQVTPKDRITLFGFGAYDLLGEKRDDVLYILFGSEFYRTDLRWDRELGRDTKMRVAVTSGWEQTRIPNQPRNARNTMVGGRVQLLHGVSKEVLYRGGADVELDAYRADDFPNADPDDPEIARFNSLFPPRDDLAVGVWSDVVFEDDGVQVTPGVRFDLYRSGQDSALGVDPRIASRIELSDRVAVLHTFGVAHQPPSFLIPLPGLTIGRLRGGLQTSLQASAGVEVEVMEATTATLTVFENIFLNMSDTLAALRPGDESFTRDTRSQGSAHGLELYLKRKLTHRLGGYLSYTLSRSMRSIGSERFPSGFDRTHVGSAALAYDLGRRWRAGGRFVLYTGVPTVPNTKGLIPPAREEHPPRDPLFYRVDVRLEKRWMLAETAWIAFVAEVMNATLNTETVLGEEIGPVTIPSLGVEGGF